MSEIKGFKGAPKSRSSSMETLIVSIDQANQWCIPPFQRPLRVNAKVMAIAEDMRSNGVEITGVITLGKIVKEPTMWVVDGQHRLEAFRMSGLTEVICDVRIVTFDNMAEMSDEFVRLNSAIARMRPDDILRGLEPSTPALQRIRQAAPYVGYDHVRRGGASGPTISMSALLRCWTGSMGETPVGNSSGKSAGHTVATMDPEAVLQLLDFLNVAHAAWGRDPEYYRLWGNLNLTVCLWMWRQLVLDNKRIGNKRTVVLTAPQFKQCLMSVSANRDYLDWLPGHNMGDRDRSPCYARLKAIFAKRLQEESGDNKKPLLPQPSWASR